MKFFNFKSKEKKPSAISSEGDDAVQTNESNELDFGSSIYHNIDLTEAEQKKYSELIATISPEAAGIPEAKQNQLIAQKIFDNLDITDLKASELTEPVRKKIISLWQLDIRADELFHGPDSLKPHPTMLPESHHRFISLVSFLQVQKAYYATSTDIQTPNDFESGSRPTDSNQRAFSTDSSSSRDKPDSSKQSYSSGAKGSGNVYKMPHLSYPIGTYRDGNIYEISHPGYPVGTFKNGNVYRMPDLGYPVGIYKNGNIYEITNQGYPVGVYKNGKLYEVANQGYPVGQYDNNDEGAAAALALLLGMI